MHSPASSLTKHPVESMATATPHVRKAAATEQLDNAELTALQVNPRNGAKSIPFRRPIRARLGRPETLALRCPFGAPKSFDPTKTDRVSFSVSVGPESDEARYAARLDEKAKSLLKARLPEFMERATPAQVDENWKPVLKEARSAEYNPTIAVKVQMTGARPCRLWIKKELEEKRRATVEEVDWTTAKVNMVCEARSVWLQPRMYGVSIEARDIIVYPEDDSCPTDDSDSD